MTLKEKFENVLHNWIDEDYNRQHVAEELEIDAEEFALGFAEWLTNEKSPYSIMYDNQEVRFSDFRKEYTAKELLQIYKKEKGL
jgi:hypothetical protein